jgi:hypothetical protein
LLRKTYLSIGGVVRTGSGSLFNRIKPTWMKRMTFQKSPYRPPKPNDDPMSSHDFGSIVRTGRLKSARGWKQRRQPSLIERD